MTYLSCTIFSGTGDSLVQKMSSYVALCKYVEVYDGLWRVLVFIGVVCTIFSGALYRLT